MQEMCSRYALISGGDAPGPSNKDLSSCKSLWELLVALLFGFVVSQREVDTPAHNLFKSDASVFVF